MLKLSVLAAPLKAVVAAGVTLAMVAAIAPAALAQEAFPSKAIRIIVPFPPGGSVDPLARVVGKRLQEALGQPVIVDNRPGGNTVVGTDATAKAPADGYTLLMTASSHVTTSQLMQTPYDPIKDFVPVATLSSSDMILVANPALPANSLRDLVALAKSRPGEITYSSAGTGNPNHLAGELLDMLAGIKTRHIPYKGGAPAINDLIGGQVQISYGSPIIVLPHIRSGRLKALAVTSTTRMAALPQVPTFAEGGVPGYDVKIWYGVLAPAGTPPAVVHRLNAEITRVLGLPDVKEVLDAAEMQRFSSSVEQFGALLATDTEKFGRIIKTANVKLN